VHKLSDYAVFGLLSKEITNMLHATVRANSYFFLWIPL